MQSRNDNVWMLRNNNRPKLFSNLPATSNIKFDGVIDCLLQDGSFNQFNSYLNLRSDMSNFYQNSQGRETNLHLVNQNRDSFYQCRGTEAPYPWSSSGYSQPFIYPRNINYQNYYNHSNFLNQNSSFQRNSIRRNSNESFLHKQQNKNNNKYKNSRPLQKTSCSKSSESQNRRYKEKDDTHLNNTSTLNHKMPVSQMNIPVSSSLVCNKSNSDSIEGPEFVDFEELGLKRMSCNVTPSLLNNSESMKQCEISNSSNINMTERDFNETNTNFAISAEKEKNSTLNKSLRSKEKNCNAQSRNKNLNHDQKKIISSVEKSDSSSSNKCSSSSINKTVHDDLRNQRPKSPEGSCTYPPQEETLTEESNMIKIAIPSTGQSSFIRLNDMLDKNTSENLKFPFILPNNDPHFQDSINTENTSKNETPLPNDLIETSDLSIQTLKNQVSKTSELTGKNPDDNLTLSSLLSSNNKVFQNTLSEKNMPENLRSPLMFSTNDQKLDGSYIDTNTCNPTVLKNHSRSLEKSLLDSPAIINQAFSCSSNSVAKKLTENLSLPCLLTSDKSLTNSNCLVNSDFQQVSIDQFRNTDNPSSCSLPKPSSFMNDITKQSNISKENRNIYFCSPDETSCSLSKEKNEFVNRSQDSLTLDSASSKKFFGIESCITPDNVLFNSLHIKQELPSYVEDSVSEESQNILSVNIKTEPIFAESTNLVIADRTMDGKPSEKENIINGSTCTERIYNENIDKRNCENTTEIKKPFKTDSAKSLQDIFTQAKIQKKKNKEAAIKEKMSTKKQKVKQKKENEIEIDDTYKSGINRYKLKKLIEFLKKDEEKNEVCESSNKKVDSEHRRKLNKANVVRNKNNSREMISLISHKMARVEVLKGSEKPHPESLDKDLTETPDEKCAFNSDTSLFKSENISDSINTLDAKIENVSQDSFANTSLQSPLKENNSTVETSLIEQNCDPKDDVTIINLLKGLRSIKQQFCLNCKLELPVDSFWLNVVSGELKCTHCFEAFTITRKTSEKDEKKSFPKLIVSKKSVREKLNSEENVEKSNLSEKIINVINIDTKLEAKDEVKDCVRGKNVPCSQSVNKSCEENGCLKKCGLLESSKEKDNDNVITTENQSVFSVETENILSSVYQVTLTENEHFGRTDSATESKKETKFKDDEKFPNSHISKTPTKKTDNVIFKSKENSKCMYSDESGENLLFNKKFAENPKGSDSFTEISKKNERPIYVENYKKRTTSESENYHRRTKEKKSKLDVFELDSYRKSNEHKSPRSRYYNQDFCRKRNTTNLRTSDPRRSNLFEKFLKKTKKLSYNYYLN